MNSLISPWSCLEPSTVGASSTRYAIEFRAYQQTRETLGIRNGRNGGIGKIKRNSKKKSFATPRTKHEATSVSFDSDVVFSVCGKQEIPLPGSLSYKESHLEQSTTPEASSGSGTFNLETTTEGLQLSRDTILSYQSHNGVERLHKILDISRRSTEQKDTLGATPYRYKLSDLENVTDHIKEQSQDQTISPWYPVFQWEKRQGRQTQIKDSISSHDKSDPESEFDSGETVNNKDSVRLESDSSIIAPEIYLDSTGVMKDQESNILPVINLSGQLILSKEHVRDSIKNIRKRLLGVPRNNEQQHSLTAREEKEQKKQTNDDIKTYRRIQDLDIMEPRAVALKLEKMHNTGTRINSTSSTGNMVSDGSSCQPHSKDNTQLSYLYKAVNPLPTLDQSSKDEIPSNVKKATTDKPETQSVKLPKVVESSDIHAQYKCHGTTSKLTKTKSYSLKDLTDVHKERQDHPKRLVSTDRSWQSKLKKTVIDLSSYDMFARKSKKKYNTTKNLNMIISNKTDPPPSRIPDVNASSGEYYDQNIYSQTLKQDGTYAYEIDSDMKYCYDDAEYQFDIETEPDDIEMRCIHEVSDKHASHGAMKKTRVPSRSNPRENYNHVHSNEDLIAVVFDNIPETGRHTRPVNEDCESDNIKYTNEPDFRDFNRANMKS